MQFQNSKLDNCSTGCSQYFTQRYRPTITQSKQKLKSKIKISELQAQYGMHIKVSKALQEENPFRNIENTFKKRQKSNSFLSDSFNSYYKHFPDAIEQKSQKNIHLKLNSKFRLEQNKSSQRIQSLEQSVVNHIYSSKQSAEHLQKGNQNIQRSIYGQQLKSNANEKQKELSIIFSVLKNEKKLINSYQQIVNKQKIQISNELNNIKKQYENCILSVESELHSQINKSYSEFLNTLQSVKIETRGLFFKRIQERLNSNQNERKLKKSYSIHKYQLNSLKDLNQIEPPLKQISKQQNYKFQNYSLNRMLLKQLSRQDDKIDQYQRVRRFYENSNTNIKVTQIFRKSEQLLTRIKLHITVPKQSQQTSKYQNIFKTFQKQIKDVKKLMA